MDVGIVQVTSEFSSKNMHRLELLKEQIIPSFIEIVGGGHYTLVSPPNDELRELVTSLGGVFVEYSGWKKDKNRKFRDGMRTRTESWVAFLDDDILPDDQWLDHCMEFLNGAKPGQYGFRLTDEDGKRHEFGEDWIQYPSRHFNLRHRGLRYDVATNFVEQSPTAYVANSFVHREAFEMVEPFGIFGKAPDVNWCFAIKEAGFPVGFIVKARAYHLGDRKDNR